MTGVILPRPRNRPLRTAPQSRMDSLVQASGSAGQFYFGSVPKPRGPASMLVRCGSTAGGRLRRGGAGNPFAGMPSVGFGLGEAGPAGNGLGEASGATPSRKAAEITAPREFPAEIRRTKPEPHREPPHQAGFPTAWREESSGANGGGCLSHALGFSIGCMKHNRNSRIGSVE